MVAGTPPLHDRAGLLDNSQVNLNSSDRTHSVTSTQVLLLSSYYAICDAFLRLKPMLGLRDIVCGVRP